VEKYDELRRVMFKRRFKGSPIGLEILPYGIRENLKALSLKVVHDGPTVICRDEYLCLGLDMGGEESAQSVFKGKIQSAI